MAWQRLEGNMKPDFALLLGMGLILASLPACGPAVPPLQAPGVNSLSAVDPSGSQQETVVAPSANPAATRGVAMGKTQAPAVPDDDAAEGVNLARQDLAHRLGVSADAIQVTAVIGQEFSADAFNCRTSKERVSKDPPLENVAGWSIVLSASGRRYEYHASGPTVVFCRPLL